MSAIVPTGTLVQFHLYFFAQNFKLLHMKQIKRAALTATILMCLISCSQERFIEVEGNLVPKTVMEDASLPSINSNGNKLHSQAFGPAEGTLIICIHGGPGANFKSLLNSKSLADKGYRVVFYDQIGSGLSQRLQKESYLTHGNNAINNIFLEELKAIIAYYKIQPSQKVILLGHSWGAMLATAFAGKYPNEINGLILGEPGGLKWNDVKEYVENSLSFGLWSEAFNDATYLDQFITGKENQHAILDYKTSLLSANNNNVGDIPSNLGSNEMFYKSSREGAVINAAMFEIGEEFKPDLSVGINQFQPKVLFFYSSNNKAYADSWAAKISSVYVNKELIKIEGVGHSGMFDQIDTWSNITEPKVINYLNSL